MLIDTHCHIHDRGTYNFAFSRQQIGKKFLRNHPGFPHEIDDFTPEKIIARAHNAGVMKMICIGTSREDSLSARNFAEKHAADGIFWSYGIHPDKATVAQSFSAVASSSLVAIGEVGLDYHETTANRTAQIKLFEQMLQLAKDNNLPLIFHVRDAYPDFFSVIANFPDVRGVVHSFSDSSDNLQKSLAQGFYIGVNGLATFAPELPTSQIPLNRILLETDAPFLTPSPFRGTINEPAHVKDVCAHLSKLKGESEANIAEITTQNAKQLFKI
ncbi:TatD family hydrolase [Candidatus Saccharibacteria bacterium]|nr:TatD family hydrolase [Candidatus Saccharibacteria bacterium]